MILGAFKNDGARRDFKGGKDSPGCGGTGQPVEPVAGDERGAVGLQNRAGGRGGGRSDEERTRQQGVAGGQEGIIAGGQACDAGEIDLVADGERRVDVALVSAEV